MRSAVARVPITSPFFTVSPTATRTDLMVPETVNEELTSRRGAMDPLAVMVLLTAPCWTVPVSWVAVALCAEIGFAIKYTPVAAARMTTASAVLMTAGRESFMGEESRTLLSGPLVETVKTLGTSD